jgi:hypothetical protein
MPASRRSSAAIAELTVLIPELRQFAGPPASHLLFAWAKSPRGLRSLESVPTTKDSQS